LAEENSNLELEKYKKVIIEHDDAIKCYVCQRIIRGDINDEQVLSPPKSKKGMFRIPTKADEERKPWVFINEDDRQMVLCPFCYYKERKRLKE
jgi:hypothetical protein